MNLVLGFLVLVILTSAGSMPIASREVASVESPGSGLRAGDVIEKVNGRRMFVFSDLDYEFARTQNGTFTIEITRDGKREILENVTFGTQIAYDRVSGEAIINEGTGEPYEYLDLGFKVWARKKTVFSVVGQAFNTTLSYARLIYLSLFDLATGKMPINSLSGPVGIVSEIGKAALMGLDSVLNLLALISVNLGLVNMLPLPALDGGKVLLLVIEGIRRKAIPPKYVAAINVAGFMLLMGLMVLVSFNDIRRLIT
jgi:regulator of sigma E protease